METNTFSFNKKELKNSSSLLIRMVSINSIWKEQIWFGLIWCSLIKEYTTKDFYQKSKCFLWKYLVSIIFEKIYNLRFKMSKVNETRSESRI